MFFDWNATQPLYLGVYVAPPSVVGGSSSSPQCHLVKDFEKSCGGEFIRRTAKYQRNGD